MKLSFLIMPELLTTFPAVNLKIKPPDSHLFYINAASTSLVVPEKPILGQLPPIKEAK